jgi:GAF domain-containing protein
VKPRDRIQTARKLLAEAARQCDSGASDLRETIAETDRELRELASLNHDMETRLAVLEIIATAKDPEQALVGSLGYLKDRLHIDAAGLRLREGDDFPYFTTTGFSNEFVQAESSLCQRDRSGAPALDSSGQVVLECMCGRVVRGLSDPSRKFFTGGGSFWTNSTSELAEEPIDDDRLGATRHRCHSEGYESVALIPLSSHDETFGLLQFNARDAGNFTPRTIALLEDLALYLAGLLT